MPAAPVPVDEDSRLAALVRYAILDTPPEAAFDRLTRLAARLFEVPIALISLVDQHRQWFKSRHGLDATETSRDHAFCAYALTGGQPLVVPDATRDPRFADNPLVTGAPDIRFYAGAPLCTREGHTLGTLCVIDREPRSVLSKEQKEALEDLARLAMEEMERRLAADRILQLERELRESETRWQLASQGANDGLFDCDFQAGTVYYSPRWKELLGYEDGELTSTSETWEALVHPADKAGVDQRIELHLAGASERYAAEYRMRHKDGEWRWILARGQACWDAAGRPVRLVGSHADITARKDAEERLSREALTDPLTGLANRRQINQQLATAVASAERHGHALTVVVSDVDHFKQVNDTHGHEVGDEVLRALGDLLRTGLRQGDTAGRLGGDEFCLLLPHTSAGDAVAVLKRIRSRLGQMRFIGAEGEFGVAATFGIAEWRPGDDPRALFSKADEALYAAKREGRGRALVHGEVIKVG